MHFFEYFVFSIVMPGRCQNDVICCGHCIQSLLPSNSFFFFVIFDVLNEGESTTLLFYLYLSASGRRHIGAAYKSEPPSAARARVASLTVTAVVVTHGSIHDADDSYC